MKKKGFTLIELLAVIVILAIIALIATPLVLKYIEKSRKESKVDSAYSFVRNLETEIANYSIKNNGKKYNKSGLLEIGEFTDIDTAVKGDTPSNGKVCLSSLGQVEKAVFEFNDGKYYVNYDGKKGSISDKDTYDNFSCSGNSGNDAVSNHIIDENLEFSFDETSNAYTATLSITKDIAEQLAEGFDYDLVIDNGEAELVYATAYLGNDLILYSHVTDFSKLKGIKVNNDSLTFLSQVEIKGLHNVKVTNKRPIEERLYFMINNIGEMYITGYDLVEGDAKVLIKDEDNNEYLDNTIKLIDNNGDGIIGADGCSRDNLSDIPEIYNALTNGKTITIEITQTVNGKEIISTVTKNNLNLMMVNSNMYFSRYYILLLNTLSC